MAGYAAGTWAEALMAVAAIKVASALPTTVAMRLFENMVSSPDYYGCCVGFADWYCRLLRD
ncbi:hypothetical protein ACFQAT_02295 [Undibacterium arcticum]|uniref:hypothetical protein n=1 Tax=Undibacterium arcticum TaxID=1762892 RepID=UPI003607047C